MSLLLTTAQAADALGFSERHFRRLVASGAIRALRIGHRSVRFRPEDLRDWIALQADRLA
jgi:excisionase family DNA binding protein